MKIDKIEVCKTIADLVLFLEKHNFRIVTQKVSDYHFHQVAIVMNGSFFEDLNNLQFENLKRVSSNLFSCSCHWSTVELEYNQ